MPKMLRYTVMAFAGAIFASGAMPLLGYITNTPQLHTPLPGNIAMAPNTALGFCLVGLALWLTAQNPPNTS